MFQSAMTLFVDSFVAIDVDVACSKSSMHETSKHYVFKSKEQLKHL